jgi:PAS domain S-box-containing protein
MMKALFVDKRLLEKQRTGEGVIVLPPSNMKALKGLTAALSQECVLGPGCILNLFPDLVCLVENSRYLKINKAWTYVTGFSEEEILATPWIEMVVPEDRERTLAEVEKMRKRPSTNFINRHRKKGPGYIELSWSCTQWSSDRKGALSLCVARVLKEE